MIISDYAITPITIMQQADVINGMGNGMFEPLEMQQELKRLKLFIYYPLCSHI